MTYFEHCYCDQAEQIVYETEEIIDVFLYIFCIFFLFRTIGLVQCVEKRLWNLDHNPCSYKQI